MYTPVFVQRADEIGYDCERLPVGMVRDLQDSHNVNLDNIESDWFDSDELPDHVRVIEDTEFFDRFVN
jgi:hypothetical protein